MKNSEKIQELVKEVYDGTEATKVYDNIENTLVYEKDPFEKFGTSKEKVFRKDPIEKVIKENRDYFTGDNDYRIVYICEIPIKRLIANNKDKFGEP